MGLDLSSSLKTQFTSRVRPALPAIPLLGAVGFSRGVACRILDV
jgi:hypothetical protein